MPFNKVTLGLTQLNIAAYFCRYPAFMKKIFSLVLFMIFYLLSASAQDTYIRGTIVQENNRPLQGITISVYKKKKISFYTLTDSLGRFAIRRDSLVNGASINITAVGFEKVELHEKEAWEKIRDLGTIQLRPATVILKQVDVKAKRGFSDTTKIDLSGQKYERSHMVNDLLSGEFGFHRDSNGQLFYNGKPVSGLKVNGEDFFGKNNLDIYRLLPALALDNIEIIESNIDDVTHTVMLRPIIKLNLKLKKEYSKGLFGNANVALGSSDRSLLTTDLYTYKDKRQISLAINRNNVNLGEAPPIEPAINFSSEGNNKTTSSTRFTYTNSLSKKVNVDFSAKGKLEERTFLSESIRKEKTINQLSELSNTSNSKLFSLSDIRLNLAYQIDSLTNLTLSQTVGYDNTKSNDSLNYKINSDISSTVSNLYKTSKIINDLSTSELQFSRVFSKPGRILNAHLKRNTYSIKNNESDDVFISENQVEKTYIVNSIRNTFQSTTTLNFEFTEPLNSTTYLNVFAEYKKDVIHFSPTITSDTTDAIVSDFIGIINQYDKGGAKLRKSYRQFSVEVIAAGIVNLRKNNQEGTERLKNINLDAEFNFDYKINEKKGFVASYKASPTYPEVYQLINPNYSLDLIAQDKGNLNLRPETKNSFQLAYNVKTSDIQTLKLTGSLNLFNSKFGQHIDIRPNQTQNIYIDNLGRAASAEAGISIQRGISDRSNLNYTNTFSYMEQPVMINDKLIVNNSYTFSQVFSSTRKFFKGALSISPIITSTYNKYFYENGNVDVITITYSDKIAFEIKKIQFELYPLFNYSHNVSNLTSFSANASIKKKLFKDMGTIWVQGYDIFNSFKFNNNVIGPTYSESVKYSNIKRYFLLGISFKFNNIGNN